MAGLLPGRGDSRGSCPHPPAPHVVLTALAPCSLCSPHPPGPLFVVWSSPRGPLFVVWSSPPVPLSVPERGGRPEFPLSRRERGPGGEDLNGALRPPRAGPESGPPGGPAGAPPTRIG